MRSYRDKYNTSSSIAYHQPQGNHYALSGARAIVFSSYHDIICVEKYPSTLHASSAFLKHQQVKM
jgi:hypothetical protein